MLKPWHTSVFSWPRLLRENMTNNPRSYTVTMENGNVITRNHNAQVQTDMPPPLVLEPPRTMPSPTRETPLTMPSPEPSTPHPSISPDSCPELITLTNRPEPSPLKQDNKIVQRKLNRVRKPNNQIWCRRPLIVWVRKISWAWRVSLPYDKPDVERL